MDTLNHDGTGLLSLGLAGLSILSGQTTAIVAAYVGNNVVPMKDLPQLIADTHKAVLGMVAEMPNFLGAGSAASERTPVAQPSQAAIDSSIGRDEITSFIDGKSYRTLKRHLTTHGYTPESYRKAYGLPVNYPMVSASYSEKRSALAKENGLGQQRRKGFANRIAA